MSGVCAKHNQYVQPGEACPYCEPVYTITHPEMASYVIAPLCQQLPVHPTHVYMFAPEHRRFLYPTVTVNCGGPWYGPITGGANPVYHSGTVTFTGWAELTPAGWRLT